MTGLNNTSQANDANLGVVHTIRAKVSYTVGSGNSVSIGKVPANAVIVASGIVVSVAFNAATTNTVDIGTSAAGTALASAVDVSAVGLKPADELATSAALHQSADTEFFAKYDSTGAAATAGTGYAYVSYALGND